MASVEDTWAKLTRAQQDQKRAVGAKRWKARWREGGASKRKSFHTKREALAWGLAHESKEPQAAELPVPSKVDLARELSASRERGESIMQTLAAEDRLTVAQALAVVQFNKDNRDDGRTRREVSVENGNHHVNQLVRLIGAEPITTLSRAEVIRAVTEPGTKLAKSSQAKRLQLMRRAFEVVGIPDPSAGYKVTIPKPQTGIALSMDQLLALSEEIRFHSPSKNDNNGRRLRANADALQGIVILAGTIGPRITEILDLTVGDLDVAARTLRISSTKTATDADEPLVRIIELPDEVLKYLSPLAENQPKTAALFRNQSGGRMDRGRVSSYVRGAFKTALNRDLHTHSLRHAAASTMLNEGEAVTTVAAILGHASPAVTLAVYAHPSEEKMRKAAATVGRKLGEAAQERFERTDEHRELLEAQRRAEEAEKRAAEAERRALEAQAEADRHTLTPEQWAAKYKDMPF